MKYGKGLKALVVLLGLCGGAAMAADTAPSIQAAPSGAYPWMAAVVKRTVSNTNDGLVCEGAVVGSKWVLTAAHCIEESLLAAGDLDVVTGRADLTTKAGSRVHVAEVIIHPDYDREELYGKNDLALLRLSTAVSAAPIEVVLPDQYQSLVTEGRPLRMVGWGAVASPAPDWGTFITPWRSPTLMQEDVVFQYRRIHCMTDSNIDVMCLGVASDVLRAQGESNTCFGGSGGPLLLQSGSQWLLAGVSSRLMPCGGLSGIAGHFTGTANALNWINQTIKERATCKATPVYRYYNPSITDTYLSTQVFYAAYGYAFRTRLGSICTVKPVLSTLKPLYEFWKPQVDHFYTKADLADGTDGYGSKKVFGYVYPAKTSARKPLCRYFSAAGTDHFYDAPADGVCKSFTSTGYTLEGIEGYILK